MRGGLYAPAGFFLQPKGGSGHGGERALPDLFEAFAPGGRVGKLVERIDAARCRRHRAADEVCQVGEDEAVLRTRRFALGLMNADGAAELGDQLQEARTVLLDVVDSMDGNEEPVVAARVQELPQPLGPCGSVQLQ